MPDLVLYHSNDMHNRSGVLDLLHRMRRVEPFLLVDCGDAIRGSNTVFHLTEPILARMHRCGYHAMAMGNREQHYLRWVQRLRAQERGFPILAANLQDLRQEGPSPLWSSTLQLKVGQVRVGLVGATPPQYQRDSSWERMTGLRFLDPERCLPPLIEELRAQNDLVIFLSHLGLKMDRQLATRLPRLDLIVGGHSHDLLPTPEKVGDTWLMQVGCHGRYLGEAHLHLEPLRLEYVLNDTAC